MSAAAELAKVIVTTAESRTDVIRREIETEFADYFLQFCYEAGPHNTVTLRHSAGAFSG